MAMARAMRRPVSTRALLACGSIGPTLFMTTFFIDGSTRPGYDPSRNFVSQLSTGERGWLQITNFVACGVLLLAGAVGLSRTPGPRLATTLIGANAVALIAAGVFVADPGRGYPPGAHEPLHSTPHSTLHGLASLTAFLSLGTAPLVVAAHTRSSPAWAAYSVLSGIVVLAFFAATVVLSDQNKSVASGPPIGVLQRISIASGFTWLPALFLRHWRQSDR